MTYKSVHFLNCWLLVTLEKIWLPAAILKDEYDVITPPKVV